MPSGRVTFVIPVLFLNAFAEMDVTVFPLISAGIVNSVSVPVYPVMAAVPSVPADQV